MPVVVHYDPPAQATDYLHRSGRTGRAGATGAVISLVGEDAMGQVKRLQRALGVPTSIETREDAPAIRLGAVDDAVAAERIDDRGGKGRSERPAPRERRARSAQLRASRPTFVRSVATDQAPSAASPNARHVPSAASPNGALDPSEASPSAVSQTRNEPRTERPECAVSPSATLDLSAPNAVSPDSAIEARRLVVHATAKRS